MRVEIAERLAECAMKACDILTRADENGNKVQISGMYAKVARFGSSLTTLGLIPTAMMFEEGDILVNNAIFETLKTFVAKEGVVGIWKPDEILKTLVDQFDSLLALYRGLKNAADYYLVKEYSMLVCASLKLALNTYPDSEKKKKNDEKGSDQS